MAARDRSGYRLNVIDSFMGKLTLQDGTIVGAVLDLSEETLTVAAEGMTVGTWPLKYCRVSRLNDSEFVLTVDGEPTTFLPADAFRFAKVAADRFSASPISERINVIRNMPLEPREVAASPPVEQSAGPERRVSFSAQRIPLAIGALVVTLTGLVALGGYQPFGSRPSVDDTPTPVTTAVVVHDGPVVFTLTPERFRELWNSTAVDLGADVALRGPFGDNGFDERISDNLGFTGFASSDGTLEGLKIDVVPTRDGAETLRSIGAIEVAIASAHPTMGWANRAAIIRQLGFTGYPDNYTLGSDFETVIVDGVRHELRFVDLQGDRPDLLLFSLWEEGGPG